MKKENYQIVIGNIVILSIDIILLMFAYHMANMFFNPGWLPNPLFFQILFVQSWVIASLLLGSYKFNQFVSVWEIVKTTIVTFLVQIPIFMGIQIALNINVQIEFLMAYYAISVFLVIHLRFLYKLIYKYIEFSAFTSRNSIIVGTGRSSKVLYNFFKNQSPNGHKFLGFFDDEPGDWVPENEIRGRISDIKRFCLDNDVEEIYFAKTSMDEELIAELKNFADDHVIYFRLVPDFGYVQEDAFNVYMLDNVPVLTTRKEPLGIRINAIMKRLFDIFFSSLVIVFIFPVIYPLIALAIRADSKGPVIFKQLRPGKRNKLFECYKFRTMYVNDDTERQATKEDSRITRVGSFLRKNSLDELPQFFNVLIGNMSVVGPRPNLISQLNEYSKLVEKYRVRHFVTPGITGYAQVNGYRGETKEVELMAKRVKYDVLYMENWSFMLDIKIIAQTVWNMVLGEKNAY